MLAAHSAPSPSSCVIWSNYTTLVQSSASVCQHSHCCPARHMREFLLSLWRAGPWTGRHWSSSGHLRPLWPWLATFWLKGQWLLTAAVICAAWFTDIKGSSVLNWNSLKFLETAISYSSGQFAPLYTLKEDKHDWKINTCLQCLRC